MQNVLHLQQQIHNLRLSESFGLEQICFAPMTYEGVQPTLEQCTVQSIFGFFNNSQEDLLYESTENGFVETYLNKIEKCLS